MSLTSPSSGTAPLVEMRDISKSFGRTRVLHRVSLDVCPGEVHVLAGENGAGKSTLIKILSGVHTDFEGSVSLSGRPTRWKSPLDARNAGIAAVHQELSLVGTMTITDNLFLGREHASRLGWVSAAHERRRTAEILRELKLDLDPDQRIERLPIAARQLLEIAKALIGDAKVIILDEPTSALQDAEASLLFDRVRRLCRGGKGIVYITHRLDEIYAIGDRITVLRDGTLAGTAPTCDLPRDELVTWMIGKPARTPFASVPSAKDAHPIALRLIDVCVHHEGDRKRLDADHVSLAVHRGEIVGLAGLRGAGTSELLHGIFASLGDRTRGAVEIDGMRHSFDDSTGSPAKSIRQGVVLLPADRRTQGLIADLGITENATLSSLARFSPRGWLDRKMEQRSVQAMMPQVKLAAPSLRAKVRVLSGGGQQKVVLMKCLLAEPKVLLLDEPTRGVDIGAKADIYGMLRDLAARGVAIVLVTSEMDELFALSDRIVAMHRGRVIKEFHRGRASAKQVLAAAMGRQDALEPEAGE